MKKTTIYVIIVFFIAGCVTATKKKEVLSEMPVEQIAHKMVDKLSTMRELPVSLVVEEIKEREKLYSLSAKNMELRDAFFIFSRELPEYNIVIDPDVSGSVTVNFEELSLDKALAIILEPLGLEYTIEENVLRVSKPRLETRTFEFVYSTSTREAKTSLKAFTGSGEGGGGSTSSSFGSIDTDETVNVWEELEFGIKGLQSDAGKLQINKRIGRIIVTDYRSNMKMIKDFINLFKEETKKQILIRAKILEVTLTEGSEFGIDWDVTFRHFDILGNKRNPGTLSQKFAPDARSSRAFSFQSFDEPIEIGITHSNFDLVIKALETQGKVSVLSSPQVSTLNAQKAIMRSVREDVVFQSQQSAGTGGNPISSTTAEPFTFGVYLDVTPYVDSEGMITMSVHPSVSSFVDLATSQDGTAQKPIIDTRETETIVTINEGETVIIAGLMKDDFKKDISKFPILGDIPYLGKVFRREVNDTSKTELVILISPTIVGPRAKDFGAERAKYRMLNKQFP
jgi:MSHA biogenesis protein MshL